MSMTFSHRYQDSPCNCVIAGRKRYSDNILSGAFPPSGSRLEFPWPSAVQLPIFDLFALLRFCAKRCVLKWFVLLLVSFAKRRNDIHRSQRSCGQGYVFTRVYDSVHRSGLPQCMLGYHPLPEQTPPGSRHPPESRYPLEQTPPQSRYSPWSRHPPRADTPPQE